MSPVQPRIGVAHCSKLTDYLEAVRKAGGEPVVLEPSIHAPDAALESMDGLVLTGGVDVDPARYGESPHPAVEVDVTRDAFEFALTHLALARNLPVLAICRGMQVLNVVAGGTLVQDIPSLVAGALRHSVTSSPEAMAHHVRIEPGTLLSRLAPVVAGPCLVNSRHHQSVKQVAPGFVVSAVSPDGVIEAMERPDARFCLGLQWHPENFHRSGEFGRIFEAFVDACRRR